MSTLPPTLSTKDRIAAVDIIRVMAAFGILCIHLPYITDGVPFRLIRWNTAFGAMSAIFFILAGFFACRKLTWKKALHNALWCLLPLILWNFIAWLHAYVALDFRTPFIRTFGVHDILLPGITFISKSQPLQNGPLWFMRDLVFLFLLSPILARYARYIFPALVVVSSIPQCIGYFVHSPDIQNVCLRPYSIAFFTAGCFLASFNAECRQKMLTFYSPTIIIVYLVINFYTSNYLQWGDPLVKHLLGLWVMYQLARWIEVRIPGAREFALKFAPVTFLTFAAHTTIYRCFSRPSSDWYLLVLPFLVFALLSVVFFAMKRWCRPLLHLVAHYKLRPDDLAPTKKGKEEAPSGSPE